MRYAFRRILMAIPTLLVVAIIVFTLMRLIPGDPAQLLVGDMDDLEAIARVRKELGLDQPLPVQFGIWLLNLLQGDFGSSMRNGEPILPTILHRFSITASFAGTALLLAALIAVPLGVIAAWRARTSVDYFSRLVAMVLVSMPTFWVGLILILIFGIHLHWLPVVGYVWIGDDFVRGLSYMLMPVTALVVGELAAIMRMARSSALEVLQLDYVAHARAKGLTERRVLLRHVLPNSLAPTLTLIGITLGNSLGGAAVTETVFSIPGLGRYLVDAIYARDYLVVQGCLMFVSFIFIVVNLLVDLCYPLLDPRVKL
ncbi:ABC transporter permease [Chelatococcus asaccharovorans]|uniref:ABC transporter permease n=1 Tax=Chelatococcus asaccharovorans TaxID=28210 RepID=UPI00224C789F|nr:ABC transporter permease [Chelatococcus asaccharovorans]CAH1658192.1 Dipeptide transport system permease protein DppB [Chelatococcus asaccharovorans]CAH1688799.1 Dipeptide transport system permease protein DppB [Chelatococcus asaccharovorans]